MKNNREVQALLAKFDPNSSRILFLCFGGKDERKGCTTRKHCIDTVVECLGPSFPAVQLENNNFNCIRVFALSYIWMLNRCGCLSFYWLLVGYSYLLCVYLTGSFPL